MESPLLVLPADVEHDVLGEDCVGDDVDLALKGADECSVPPDVNHDALDVLAGVEEVYFIPHLKGVLQESPDLKTTGQNASCCTVKRADNTHLKFQLVKEMCTCEVAPGTLISTD